MSRTKSQKRRETRKRQKERVTQQEKGILFVLQHRNWPGMSEGKPKSLKEIILITQRYRCFYCFNPLKLKDSTVDHIIPKSEGGTDTMTNKVVSCSSCNMTKSSKRIPDSIISRWIEMHNQ